MFWAPALMLMTVVAPSAPVASTYDEVACARPLEEGAQEQALVDDVGDCRVPVVAAAPAIIDCNDPGVSIWVGEMIGSCDMPRPIPPTGVQPTAGQGARNGPIARVCDGLHCNHQSSPLRPAPRPEEVVSWALGARLAL